MQRHGDRVEGIILLENLRMMMRCICSFFKMNSIEQCVRYVMRDIINIVVRKERKRLWQYNNRVQNREKSRKQKREYYQKCKEDDAELLKLKKSISDKKSKLSNPEIYKWRKLKAHRTWRNNHPEKVKQVQATNRKRKREKLVTIKEKGASSDEEEESESESDDEEFYNSIKSFIL